MAPAGAGMKMKMLLRSFIVALVCEAAAAAASAAALPQHCVRPAIVLWGDGRHDDTKALQAWLRGEDALWGDSGAPVGAAIRARDFRLSAAIYVDGGTGRTLEDFRLTWPERGEAVTGGMIRAGRDPKAPPIVSGVRIVGGDSGEGKPFDLPDAPAAAPRDQAGCGIS
jgi:hypothetical protein